MNIIEGSLIIEGKKIAIVASRFNEFIVSKLIDGASDCLTRHGLDLENLDLVWVPGAYEIPMMAKLLAKKNYDGVICLGAVIRGATSHYDYVCNEVSKGIAQVSLELEKPISFGIITTENIEQAIERAGTKSGNKGFDAALSMIEMINLREKIIE